MAAVREEIPSGNLFVSVFFFVCYRELQKKYCHQISDRKSISLQAQCVAQSTRS